MSQIQQALQSLFIKYRIVFWYDAKQELVEEFNHLDLPGITKIDLQNNAYGLKHRMLKEESTTKFLIYHAGPQPDDLDNWLLDVQLANGTFNADQISLWLTELGLGMEFWELVQSHTEYFRVDNRRISLKQRLEIQDSHNVVRQKMLAVCVNSDSDNNIESVIEILINEDSKGSNDDFALIQKCGLEPFLWDQLKSHFSYSSEVPSVKDFSIELFKSSYALLHEEPAKLNKDALIFLKKWKDNITCQKSFESLSDQYSDILNIQQDLSKRELEDLIDIDLFKVIDQQIITLLISQVVKRTINQEEVKKIIWLRGQKHWFNHFKDIYEAIYYGSLFLSQMLILDPSPQSLADGVNKYQNTWYLLDFYYRKFIFHAKACNEVTLLKHLSDKVENLYTNNYLLKVNDAWQPFIDKCQKWGIPPYLSQSDFFERFVQSFLQNKNKVAVVISDALRFEVGEELKERIVSEDRYQAELEPMIAQLPSYTQLGMAALLPHHTLTLTQDNQVEVDGQSTQGIENRSKVLDQFIKGSAAALHSTKFMEMNHEESRQLVKDNQVIYIYHNQIDAIGDKNETEGQVFDAAEKALQDLVEITKKLTNANINNLIITSDHGFIYQNQPITESDFSIAEPAGGEILVHNRRFLIGKDLIPTNSVKLFHSSDLGLGGDLTILFPKSINRLRQKGSGSRYVHGGISLQEVIIPVIKISKKRVSDIDKVNVEIITSSSTIITSGQILVKFFQKEPVTAKVKGRSFKIGIYTQDNLPISDEHVQDFNLKSQEARDREVSLRFVLSHKADSVNNQIVYLKIFEPIEGTAHYQEYLSMPYQLRRSFTSDFD